MLLLFVYNSSIKSLVKSHPNCHLTPSTFLTFDGPSPGGELSECGVLDGVMFNKDVTHSKMRRRIENPRILLLDCPLEYKKGESQTNVEIMKEEDFNALLRQEEEYVEQICAQIVAAKPDIVITEKGDTRFHTYSFPGFHSHTLNLTPAIIPYPITHHPTPTFPLIHEHPSCHPCCFVIMMMLQVYLI